MQRRRCGMRGQRRRRATPPFTIHRVPSERSRRRTSCATERRCLASPLLPCPLLPCPLLSSVSLHLVVVFRRTLRAAHGIAVEGRAFTSYNNRRPSSANELQRPNTSRSADMKYSPQQQQQQQKQRKSESSDAASMDATSPSVVQEQRKTSSTSSSTRATVCRSPSTGMFAWMRVFRLASMLHQVGC